MSVRTRIVLGTTLVSLVARAGGGAVILAAQSPPDPDSWRANLVTGSCIRRFSHGFHPGGNVTCFSNASVDQEFAKGATTFGPSRGKYYRKIQEIVAKNAFWSNIAPRPNIFTTDGKPRHGYEMNSWQSPNTWNSQMWSS